MYDTVPEIQDTLTTDATETWIHACDWRVCLPVNFIIVISTLYNLNIKKFKIFISNQIL